MKLPPIYFDPKWFKPLLKEDIAEKVLLNLKDGHFTLETLFKKLREEYFANRRIALYDRAKHQRLGWKRIFKESAFQESQIILDIQAQNLVEQLEFLKNKIKEQ